MKFELKNLVAALAVVAIMAVPSFAKSVNPDDLPDTASTDAAVPSVTVTSVDKEVLVEANKKALKKARKGQAAERRHLLNIKMGFFGFHLM